MKTVSWFSQQELQKESSDHEKANWMQSTPQDRTGKHTDRH